MSVAIRFVVCCGCDDMLILAVWEIVVIKVVRVTRGGITPIILNVGTIWRRVLSLAPRPGQEPVLPTE
jgi:hypothetical protein